MARDTSGLCAVAGHPDAARQVWRGLKALQHRGDAGASLAVADGQQVRMIRGLDVTASPGGGALDGARGSWALGQVYGRKGRSPGSGAVTQMVHGHNRGCELVVAVSGRFRNARQLRAELESQGALFSTRSEAELLAMLIARSDRGTPVNRIVDALWQIEGGYAALIMTPDRIVAVRDSQGIRPLVVGKVDEGWAIACEDAAIRAMGGWVERELDPGEMLILDRNGGRVVRPLPRRQVSSCLCELVSVARPDGHLYGHDVHQFRVELGARLAQESPPPSQDAIVVSLPDGSQSAAIGYANGVSLAYEPGLMATSDGEWLAVPGVVRERKVILVGARMATGAAVRRGVHLLREAGAKEVVVCVASPAVRAPCRFGLDSPMQDELALAPHEDESVLVARLGADEVRCLSHEALLAVASHGKEGGGAFSALCFGGSPELASEEQEDQLEMF